MGDPAGIGWLHLGSLFLDRQGGPTTSSEVRELLEHDLRRIHAVSGPWDLVAICGNITQNGDVAEFNRAGQVLEWLWTVLHSLDSDPSLVVVPDQADRGVREPLPAYIGDERDVVQRGMTDEPTRVTDQLAEFTRFSARQRDHLRQGHVWPGMGFGDSSLRIDRNGLRVGVLGLDTSIVLGHLGARLVAACGADPAEWTRRSDAVIIVGPIDDERFAGRFLDLAVPVVWLCSDYQELWTMRSPGRGSYLAVSAPQLYAYDRGSFGYSAGRMWVSGDETHARIWHRCLNVDQEPARLGPPRDAIVDGYGAVTLALPAVGAPASEPRPRSTRSPATASRSAVLARAAESVLARSSALDRDSTVNSIQVHGTQIRDLAWSPDGQRIAAISGMQTLTLYGRDRTRITSAMIPDAAAVAIAWSPDGSRLATRSRSEVHIWSAQGTRLHSFELVSATPAAMAWTASDELALGSDRGTYRWSLPGASAQTPGAPDHASPRSWKTAGPVIALAVFRPHGIAAIGTSEGILLGDIDANETPRPVLKSPPVHALAWGPDGMLAAGDARGVVTVLRPSTSTALTRLEFLTDAVRSLSFSHDGKLLAATTVNGSFCAWSVDDWKPIGARFTKVLNVVAFSPTENLLALGALDGLQIESLASARAADGHGFEQPVVRTASAKVVLLGEGNVGKSCLALRLTQDRYEEIGSTHGMKFWSVPLEQLDPDADIPPDERREVVFWDMGGQHEYRLLHHAFLHDTMLALMVMEPRRGEVALQELEEWERQLTPDRSRIKRILVGSKLDDPSAPRDPVLISRALADGRFAEYAETSARYGHGVDALRKTIARAIDWTAITATTRSQLFHRIRNHIDLRRKARRIVIPFDELEDLVRQREGSDIEPAAVAAVVQQLARQGLLADARLGDGSRMVILEVEQVERYAASLILAARDNPRGVPALELASVVSVDMSFPRIAARDRLPRDQELVILECVVDLLIKSGICFRSGRLLIFPALFRSQGSDDGHTHAVAIAYDLVGPVDAIYSSLVCWLALGQGLGAMRLWEHRVEFARPVGGVCGLRRAAPSARSAAARRFEVYFDDAAEASTREFFAGVIDDFLRTQGVEMIEQLATRCVCGHEFTDDDVRHRIVLGASDIGCPRCDARVPLVRTGDAASGVPGLTARIHAFRTETGQIRRDTVTETRVTLDEVRRAPPVGPGVHILHLSDLHITADADLASLLQPLCSDLEDSTEGLGRFRPDLVVVSGDLTNRATPEEFEAARQFLTQLLERLKLTTERCVVVPGNHDLSWEVRAYQWMPKRQVPVVDPVRHVRKDDGFLVRCEAEYPDRFRNFAQYLFHPLFQRPYSLSPTEQGQCVLYEDLGLQLLALNSAWQIDEHFPDRSAIHPGSLHRLLDAADEAVRDARQAGRLREATSLIRIALWHHPITGNEKIVDDAFVDAIRRAGVRLCLHGHVHDDRADLLGYLHPTSRLHVIGAGSFGAPARERPESIPRLYNLLEIDADRRRVRVHTRSLQRTGGAWEPRCTWPGKTPDERRSFYEVDLGPSRSR
ncbi:MAG TPA: metallophosphoesterase [Kofleriaceae bacterium]|jgi:small GTP-binding protein|nr:metallophosphoesterase [Kofleriaceae bacterium]